MQKIEGLEHYFKREFFTISELDTFSRCPRNYFYSAGCGLRLADRLAGGNEAMDFGTAIHVAAPIILAGGSFEEAYAAFLKVWGSRTGDEKRNAQTAKMILFTFASAHPPNGLYVIKKPPKTTLPIVDKISDWEVPFALNIPGLPLPLLGRIDGWCETRMGSELWALEYKTSGEMSGRFFNSFKRNPQTIGYVLAMKAHGFDIKGIFVECIGVAKTTWKVQTIPITPSAQDFEDFITWAQMRGAEIMACEENGIWPKDISACTTYPQYGQPGYECRFDPLCSVPNWTSMKSFYNIERHMPFVLPTIKGEPIEAVVEKQKDIDHGKEIEQKPVPTTSSILDSIISKSST